MSELYPNKSQNLTTVKRFQKLRDFVHMDCYTDCEMMNIT